MNTSVGTLITHKPATNITGPHKAPFSPYRRQTSDICPSCPHIPGVAWSFLWVLPAGPSDLLSGKIAGSSRMLQVCIYRPASQASHVFLEFPWYPELHNRDYLFSVIFITLCLEWRVSSLSKGVMSTPLLHSPHMLLCLHKSSLSSHWWWWQYCCWWWQWQCLMLASKYWVPSILTVPGH